MEQSRGSRNIPGHISSIWSLTKGPRTYTGGKIASLINSAGKLDIHMQKIEYRPTYLTIYQTKIKNGSKFEC